jgi:hypothetical protein
MRNLNVRPGRRQSFDVLRQDVSCLGIEVVEMVTAPVVEEAGTPSSVECTLPGVVAMPGNDRKRTSVRRLSQNDTAKLGSWICLSKTYTISRRSFTNSQKKEAHTEPQLCMKRTSCLRRPYAQFMNWNRSKGE